MGQSSFLASSRTRLRAVACAIVTLVAVGCGSADDAFNGGGGACEPGEKFECTCASGSSGIQVCAAEGDALSPCDCSGGVVDNGAGGIAPLTGGAGGTGGAIPTGGAGGAIPTGGTGGVAPPPPPTGGATCCPTGDCICRDEPPPFLTSDPGPYATNSYSLPGVGCIHYPTNAQPPFSAVAVSDGYLGTGGCSAGAQTSGWGPFYASYGIVTMIIETLGSDQPPTRGQKLLGGIAGLKAENGNPASPIHNLLAGRYGTSGFSMGGGGTTYAATNDPTLRTSVGLMSWTPVGAGVTVPTLFTCGSSDGLATCSGHTIPAYGQMPPTTPKMRVTVPSGHAGQPSSGNGEQGAWGLAFQKVFLDGDERWRPILLSGASDETNIQ